MPAGAEEIEGSIEEGIGFNFLSSPVGVIPKNGRLQLTCIRMELGEPDASGRRRPEPVKGSEFIAEYDTVITAIGQIPDIPESYSLEKGRGNTLKVDTETLSTNLKGVFAGGDVATGPATVTEAMAAGRKAAVSIDRYLGGSGNIKEALVAQDEMSPCLGRDEGFAYNTRKKPPCLEVNNRIDNFKQVELAFDEETAVGEANRCLRCDLRLQIGKPEAAPVAEQMEDIFTNYAR